MSILDLRKVTWPKLLLLTAMLASGLLPTVARAGNDFVDAELRTDSASIATARDYTTVVYAAAKPSVNGAYTNGWLGVDLARFTGVVYSAQFSQVGVMTDSGGVKWFVYAEPGVQCLRGTTAWGTRGCVGAYSDLVGLNQWVKVELVSYGQGFWIARLYDTKGLGHDVAKIWSNSLTIYRGMDVSEEGWWTSTDQYLTMAYYHWHPKYMVWGQGFRDWMDGNYLFTSPGSLCASHYGAWVTLAGDPHYWWAGNGGPTCYVQYLF